MRIQVASYRHDANGTSAHLFRNAGEQFEILYTDNIGRSTGREAGDWDFALVALHTWDEMVHEKKGSFTHKDEVALRDIGIGI